MAAEQPSATASAGEIQAPVADSDSSRAPASVSDPGPAAAETPVDLEPQAIGETSQTHNGQTDSFGQVVSDAGSVKPTGTPQTGRNQPPFAGAPSRPVPEPVSSRVATAPERQVSSPTEPAAIEPAVEAVDGRPLPSEETGAGQAVADLEPPAPEKPAYQGPKRGVVIWTGDVDKGTTVVIEGASANTGQVQGALPGVACMVRLSAPNVAVTEGPGPRNEYRRISLRFNKKGRFSIPVEWEVLH